MEKQEFRPIEGYEGRYEISNFGNVRNSITGRILSNSSATGYCTTCLTVNGISSYKYVHRLIAIAFIPNPEDKSEVNHIDGDKLNNSIDNLEWCTHKENMEHASKTGLFEKEYKIKRNKEIIKKYKTGKYMYKDLGLEYNLCGQAIYVILKNSNNL